MDVRQRVTMLLLALLCVILACKKARLGFLNLRSVRRLAAFNITDESISTLCLSLTVLNKFCLYS